MLVDGAVQTYPYVGVAVVGAAALNGIAVLKAFFLVFTGKRHASSVSLKRRGRERFAVLILAVLILGGGLLPQPGVASRHRAAQEILHDRLSVAEQAIGQSFQFHSSP
jgi:NADH-quinone oxidoreductase subunit M